MALDWSWEGLKNSGKGLLTDPAKMQAATENPWFQMGMGLLSENSKPFGGNPAAGVMQGLGASKQQAQDAQDRQRMEELRAQLAAMIKQQQTGYPGGVAGTPGGPINMTPTPQSMQPPRSIMNLTRTQ